MNWLKKIVPWIGAAATGNVPALITMAANEVGKVLGVEVKPEAAAIADAISKATPEQLLALKQADNDFAIKMRQLVGEEIKTAHDFEVQMAKIDADDRASARAMQKDTKSYIPAALAITITIGFFGLLTGMMLGKLHVTDAQALLIMLGSLTTAFGMVVAFYFGSSASSERKTELLAQAPSIDSKGDK